MSIVPLAKVTFYGHVADKQQTLTGLQELGCLHLIPLKPEEDRLFTGGPSSHAREALRFLMDCPNRRRQVRDPAKFDAAAVEQESLDLKNRILALEDERDFLVGRIQNLKPWGEFTFPPRKDLRNQRLWFYIVPHNDMKKVAATNLIWEVVFRDSRFAYVVVISENEPERMPVTRTRTGNRSLSELEGRLEDVEIELEDLQAARMGLTRWCSMFSRGIHRLEDEVAVSDAARQTYDVKPVFALQGWAPRAALERLQTYAHDEGLVLEITDPSSDETPPTLLKNPPILASGQDMVSFYMTPLYWLWDPSIVVFFSFAVFFAMIFGDAGYSALLGLILTMLWKPMGRSETGRRFRVLLTTMVGAGLAYGVMVGSYFGVTPAEDTFLFRLKILDMMNFDHMMMLSIMIGVLHLIVANAITAWDGRRSLKAMAPAGWVFIFLGGVLLWLGVSGDETMDSIQTVGVVALGLGMTFVVFFTSVEGPLWRRILSGLQGLTRLSGAFGDALSYLRLFALGLASASLAGTFNELAGQVRGAVPGIGLLFALLIIVLGHGLNFVLAISSGLIHGLRLNFIEFFKWSVSEEGHPFHAFARKEKISWRT